MTEWTSGFVETLSNNQIRILRDLFEFRTKRINWDFDQIFVDSEVPVKEKFFIDTGIDYRDRKIDQWLALSHWAALVKTIWSTSKLLDIARTDL